MRFLVGFGLLNTLPFPLSIFFDIFGNTLGAISQVVPLGFQLPPMFGFLDSILRGKVIGLIAEPLARALGMPEHIAYFGPESPAMLVWFALTMVTSAVAAFAWNKLAPRPSYEKLRSWAHLWFRWFLATMMLRYGAMKVFDTQFGEPIAQQLLTPAGELSRMQLLWMVFGASPSFELFCGFLEMLGALLLLHRKTLLAGLLLLLGALAQIVILNWMCGINVKFTSGFLLGVNLALLVPYWPRILGLLRGDPVPLGSNLSVLDHVKNPGKLGRLGWVFSMAYLFTFHMTAIRQSHFTDQQFPKQWIQGAWEIVELEKNGKQLSKSGPEDWRNLSFDLYRRLILTAQSGERSEFIYSYDPKTEELKLNAIGPRAQRDGHKAWKSWKLLPETDLRERAGQPEAMELRGLIGKDRYRVRAKKLRFKLLGET